MKKKIESILQSCSEEVFLNLGESIDHIDKDEVVKKILNLLPKPRYPEKDGWPGHEDVLVGLKGTIIHWHYNGCDIPHDTEWWLPVSELLEILELVGEK